LSLYQRGIAIGIRKASTKYKEIEINLDISTGALRSTLTKEQLRPEGIAQSRSGRPTTYSEVDERNLLQHVRLNPKHTYEEARVACNFPRKRDTIKCILKRHSITNWRARRWPFLIEINAAKRLAWCLKMRDYTYEE
jgi:hypothetical protein